MFVCLHIINSNKSAKANLSTLPAHDNILSRTLNRIAYTKAVSLNDKFHLPIIRINVCAAKKKDAQTKQQQIAYPTMKMSNEEVKSD